MGSEEREGSTQCCTLIAERDLSGVFHQPAGGSSRLSSLRRNAAFQYVAHGAERPSFQTSITPGSCSSKCAASAASLSSLSLQETLKSRPPGRSTR